MNITDYYILDDFLDVLPEAVSKQPNENTQEATQGNWLVKAMQGVGEGERNGTGAKIAGYWINKVPPKDVELILSIWNQNNKPKLSENELQTILKSVSRYEPNRAKPRVDISHVYDYKRMLDEYQSYIKSLKQNRFITGIHEIDKRIRGVAGGEVLTIIARAGSFKTAMLQNLLKNYIKNSA